MIMKVKKWIEKNLSNSGEMIKMSRSKKKTPIRGVAGNPDKESKREANRLERKVVKQILHEHADKLDEIELPIKREVSDVWSFNKDGKSFIKDATDKDLRK